MIAVYRQNRPNPAQGPREAGSGRTVVTATPAGVGRYLETVSATDAGRKPTTIWRPNSTPNSDAIAPAVLRSRAPRPNPNSPTAVRYRALPSTARATPGWFREVLRCSLDRTDWPIRNVAKVAGMNSTGAVSANTMALPHST